MIFGHELGDFIGVTAIALLLIVLVVYLMKSR